MGTVPTREQVLALAPDDSSAKAAGGLVSDSKWVTLGADGDAVWGECQGSGAKPYQAQVDLAALVSRCSCPSRKFPCKHGLALLLLFAQQNPRFAGAMRPGWVDEWLASRRERSEKKDKAVAADTVKAAADPEAAAAATAKREAGRWKRIEDGTAELERWMADLLRRGLAKFGPEQRKEWESMAARMIDAQAPGLAPRVLEALALMSAGSARYGDVVERIGLLQLINEGVRRRARMSPARLADLRAALGWPAEKEDVLATGEALSDHWLVLGQTTTEPEAKLTERRVWLRGVASRRDALLQEFSYAGKPWERAWRQGTQQRAELRFYAGSVPLRAIAREVGDAHGASAAVADGADVAFDTASQAFARNPWLPVVPLVLESATPFRDDDRWRLHSRAGSVPLRIEAGSGWSLLAFSGGHTLGAMGEWDGSALRLLSAWDRDGAQWSPEAGA
jgi:hypothetical protein